MGVAMKRLKRVEKNVNIFLVENWPVQNVPEITLNIKTIT
jgi:hypothetical protein